MSLTSTSSTKKIPTSYFVLLLSNLISIYFAVTQHWLLGEVALIYFLQSVVIGAFNFFKILSLETFSTDGLTSNGLPVKANSPKAKKETALFFLAHYGIFHIVMGIFLITHNENFAAIISNPYFLLTFVLFIFNHFFSFQNNYEQDRKRNLNIGTLLFFPYVRVLPTVLGCFMLMSKIVDENFLLYFMLLKTAGDLLTHAIEHAMKKN